MNRRIYRIGVMVEGLNGYGTKILDGFTRYVHEKDNWRIALFDRGRNELLHLLEHWQGDAILATLISDAFHDIAEKRDIPIVNVAGLVDRHVVPSVLSDDTAAGGMAANYLIGQGFQNFCFIHLNDGTNHSLNRGKGYLQALQKKGFSATTIQLPQKNPDDALLKKLKQLPRPLGVFTTIDRLAAMTIEACWNADLNVPEEVAILGAGNHRQLCELTSPTLSSVDLDMERRGYEAGILLDKLLKGRKPPRKPIRVSPAYVAGRRSSDVYAFEDREVAKALRFIHDHANQSIKVNDVVAATGISRRSLESRFSDLVGETLHDEIWRAHFNRAKILLISSDMSLQDVAERSGFRNASALVSYFRTNLNITPKSYRIQNRT